MGMRIAFCVAKEAIDPSCTHPGIRRSPIKFAVIDFRTLLIRCTCRRRCQHGKSSNSKSCTATNSRAKRILKKKTKKWGRRGFGKFRPHPLLGSQLSDLAKASSSSSPSSSYHIIAFRIPKRRPRRSSELLIEGTAARSRINFSRFPNLQANVVLLLVPTATSQLNAKLWRLFFIILSYF